MEGHRNYKEILITKKIFEHHQDPHHYVD